MSSMLDASRPASTGEDKRSKLKAGLLKQMQNQYGRDPVRSRLIEGELGHAPELRDKALTPAGLKAIEARVATAMANVSVGVGSDHRSMLPAEKKERKSRDASSDYNADLKSLATWTEVNKYREDFFNYEIKKDAEHRVTQLSKLKLELKHQQMEQAKKREQKKAVVRLAAEEEAKRYATYLKDSAAEEATRQAKSQMEIDMRSQQSEERRARRAVEQRLKELEDGETLRKINEQQEADRKAFEQKVKDDEKVRCARITHRASRGGPCTLAPAQTGWQDQALRPAPLAHRAPPVCCTEKPNVHRRGGEVSSDQAGARGRRDDQAAQAQRRVEGDS